MKVQMEEEKVIIDRERAVAEGKDAEAKEEEVRMPLTCCRGTSRYAGPLSYWRAAARELLERAVGATNQQGIVTLTVY